MIPRAGGGCSAGGGASLVTNLAGSHLGGMPRRSAQVVETEGLHAGAAGGLDADI